MGSISFPFFKGFSNFRCFPGLFFLVFVAFCWASVCMLQSDLKAALKPYPGTARLGAGWFRVLEKQLKNRILAPLGAGCFREL